MTGTMDETKFPARDRLNDRMVREVRYTGPALYVAGGDPIGPGDTGMAEVFGVYGILTSGTAVLLVSWDYANQKLQFFVPNSGAQATGDLSTFSGTLLFTGKG